MSFVTDFGDQAVVLPLAIAVGVALLMMGWWRGTMAWAAAVGGVFLTMVLLKGGSMMLADDYGTTMFGSPSGHTATACAVYGGVALLLLRETTGRAVALMVAAAIAALIGVSRVVLQAHTPHEAIAGAVVGVLGVAALSALSPPRPAERQLWPLAVVTLATMMMLHGQHLPVEDAIRHTVFWLDGDFG